MKKTTTIAKSKMTQLTFEDAVVKKMKVKTDRRLEVSDLSPDQRFVYDKMKAWSEKQGYAENVLSIGGFGGTGKTSLLSVFAHETPLLIAYATVTGRASSVLNRKLAACGVQTTNMLLAGQDRNGEEKPLAGYSYGSFAPEADMPYCGTIHRLLYKPIINEATEEILGWTRRKELDRGYDLIVVDEASMCSDEMLADLLEHGTPIMAVGDHGQLPPVMGKSSLMESPHLRLEQIHRQAEGSAIIQLSKSIREKGRYDFDLENGETVIFRDKACLAEVLKSAYEEDDPIDVGLLCWTNKNRVKLNAAARAAAGFRGPPKENEVVLWLRNQPPVYNGMRGVLTTAAMPGGYPWHLKAKVAFPEENLTALEYTLCSAQFNREKTFGSLDELHDRGINVEKMGSAGSLADFGYTLTCHKSQGSAFKHAIVYSDMGRERDDWRRWAYTAVTRAAVKLTVLV